jgi:hypothetical protein
MKIAKMLIEFEEKAKKDTSKLRGFFANNFTEIDFFHNHTPEGKYIYRYPRIQYRFFNNRPALFAFNEGVDILKEYYDKFDTIKIGCKTYKIAEKNLKFSTYEIKETDDYIKYKFITPWYPLNQDNHKRYLTLTTNKEKDEFLTGILISNILRMCKEMGYRINKKIALQVFFSKKFYPIIMKKMDILAFDGYFKTNIDMPDYVGLGKGTAKGFGCIMRVI